MCSNKKCLKNLVYSIEEKYSFFYRNSNLDQFFWIQNILHTRTLRGKVFYVFYWLEKISITNNLIQNGWKSFLYKFFFENRFKKYELWEILNF